MSGTSLGPLMSWRGSIADKDSGLDSTTRLVALTLSLHMNERGGSCFPGATLLSEETGLAVSTVRTHLARLVDSGWLKLTRKGGKKGEERWANRYIATMPDPTGKRTGTDVPVQLTALDPSGKTTLGRTGGRTEEEQVPAPAGRNGKEPTEHQAMFDAVVAAFELELPLMDSMAKQVGRVSKELRAKGFDPAEVAVRLARYQAKYPEAPHVSPQKFLDAHWSALARPTRPKLGKGLSAIARVDQREQEEDDGAQRSPSRNGEVAGGVPVPAVGGGNGAGLGRGHSPPALR